MIDELYLYSCVNEPNKSPWREGSGPFLFKRSAISPPQADHVLVVLFFICVGPGDCVKAPRQYGLCCGTSSIPNLRIFIMNRCWILSKFFCIYSDGMILKSFILLIWCITFIDLCILNHSGIPGINIPLDHGEWMILLIMCSWIQLACTYWEFLHWPVIFFFFL